MARKTKEEASRTKQKLLQSALEIMSGKPYSSISMTEIAERIGYSKGAVYWHFKNKHDVLVNLVNDFCTRNDAYLTEAMSQDGSLEGLRAFFQYKMKMPTQNDQFKMFYKMMSYRQEWTEDIVEKIVGIIKNRINIELKAIEKTLVDLQKEGKIKTDIDTKETAALISALFEGIFMFQVEDSFYRIDFSKYVDMLFDALEKQLAA